PANICIHVVHFRNGNKPVVAYLFLAVELLTLDYADQASLNSAAGESGLSHQKKHVDWIAVRRNCLRQEAKVIGKNHPGWKNLFLSEYAPIRGVCEFVAT